jgi:glycosyltransferase involved in cell wall biosynthesis
MWVACPGAAEVAVELPYSKLVYQRSDSYEELPGVDAGQVRRYDTLLKAHADIVVYANRELMNKEKQQCRKSLFLDHGVDYELFAGAEKDAYIPEEMRQIRRPVLGFYGNIDDHTSDIALIERLADLLGEFSIVLIGNSSVDLTALAARKNVHLLGQRPYEQIAHYAKCFDVCFMPWRQNKWVEACNPVKLKEYLALGKPVVSTRFKEAENYRSVVSVADDAESFAAAVRRVLAGGNGEMKAMRRSTVSGCTWDAKANEMLNVIFR